MSKTLWGGMIAALFVAHSAGAEQDRLQPDFTFRRVKPPSANHSGPRITVQITPQAQPAPLSGADPLPASAAIARGGSGGAEWFWNVVPDDLNAPAATRVQAALHQMSVADEARNVPTPRLQAVQAVAGQYGRDLLAASVGTKVSPALALAVISVESGGAAEAQSGAGAQGLMQLMPDTASRFDVADPLDPAQNIRGGIAYLDWLIGHFDGDTILALAAYNAGEGALRDHKGIPPYPETRAYVPKVLAAWSVAKGLCLTPPVLMSDGCVFISG
ncbi:MAG: lytic murein transglycosylase [Rhodobacterales bacterium]|nr:MAG: lytic murein transglycosylase [Rhodobacterales bacterium]